MFLQTVIDRNRPLVEFAFFAHKKGLLLPDTYVLDLDSILSNAGIMKETGDKNGITLYYMMKQLGRNPLISHELQALGYPGSVAVDWKEALVQIQNGLKLGNVGHLVQIPKAALRTILASRPEIFTVYSIEIIKEIDDVCSELGIVQPIMLRVYKKGDSIYSGQECGFGIDSLESVVKEVSRFKHVNIQGVCSFPCFLYDQESMDLVLTHNADTVIKSALLLRSFGIDVIQINMPSATCCETIKIGSTIGATHMEPGHSLTGTTPWHRDHTDAPEIPAYVYLSEISHEFGGKSLCYGGGHYRRSHMEEALVGMDLSRAQLTKIHAPTDDSIDYHFVLDECFPVSSAVVMSFRTQIFVTRSDVAVISGLSKNKPEIVGIYSSLGEKKR